MGKRIFGLIAVFLLVVSSAYSHAAPVTFYYSGVVTSFSPVGGIFSDSLIGEPMSGAITFDDSMTSNPDQNPINPEHGTYDLSYFSLRVGTSIFETFVGDGNDYVGVSNNVGDSAHNQSDRLVDAWTAEAYGNSKGLFVTVYGPTTFFSSDAIVVSPPDISQATIERSIKYQIYPLNTLVGELTYLSEAPPQVPIPTTIVLFGSALAGLAVIRRKYSKIS